MKTISLFLALINSIVAGLLLALTLSTMGIRVGEIPWFVAKFLAGASVILIGLLTWVACARAVTPGIQRGLFTGAMEYSMAFFGGSLLVQGMTSLLGFASDSRSMAAS